MDFMRHCFSVFFLVCILCGSAFALNPPYGTGVLSITNQTVPRECSLGSNGIVLDPTLTVRYDYTNTGLYIGVTLPDRSTWQGGAVYVTLDPVQNGNVTDRLSCQLANPAMTSSYNMLTRVLTITANNTITYADIQTTLRTVALRVTGQCVATRTVRIWFETTGFKFCNSRNGRVYSFVEVLRNGGSGAFTWVDAHNDFSYSGGMPRNFGMVPYYASVGSALEEARIKSMGYSDGWIGARSVPASVVASNQVAANFDYSSSAVAAPYTGPWAWVAGPDKGLVFWTGSFGSGSSVAGRFHSWQTASEPNGNSGGNTPAAAGLWSGGNDGFDWGDWVYNAGPLQRYFIEYGGMPDDQNVITVRVSGGNAFLWGSPY